MSYSKLRGKIRETFGTQGTFAAAMGMNTATLSAKLNGKSDWTRAEMERACPLLGIPMVDMHEYFFCPRNCENATERGDASWHENTRLKN